MTQLARTPIAAAALAAALAGCGLLHRASSAPLPVAAPSQAPAPQQQTWSATCSVVPYAYGGGGWDPSGEGAWDPSVTLTNTSGTPLPVSQVSVDVATSSGTYPTQVDPHDVGVAYIPPGQSMTFDWVPGDFTIPGGTQSDTCTVTAVQ